MKGNNRTVAKVSTSEAHMLRIVIFVLAVIVVIFWMINQIAAPQMAPKMVPATAFNRAKLEAIGVVDPSPYEEVVPFGMRRLINPFAGRYRTYPPMFRVAFYHYEGRRGEAIVNCTTPQLSMTDVNLYGRKNIFTGRVTYYVYCAPRETTAQGP